MTNLVGFLLVFYWIFSMILMLGYSLMQLEEEREDDGTISNSKKCGIIFTYLSLAPFLVPLYLGILFWERLNREY